jgi:uncharacterized membrane protein
MLTLYRFPEAFSLPLIISVRIIQTFTLNLLCMKAAAKTIIVLSILGILNASYLTYLFIREAYIGSTGATFCDINPSVSCSSVIVSPYAQLFGLPICTIALLIYPVLLILAILALKKKQPKNIFFTLGLLASMGMMMNLIYIYNEYAFIGSYCLLCIICSLLIITIFIMSIVGYVKSPLTVILKTNTKTPLIKSKMTGNKKTKKK